MVKRFKTAGTCLERTFYEKFQEKCAKCGKSSNQVLKEAAEEFMKDGTTKKNERNIQGTNSELGEKPEIVGREASNLAIINDID
jgi:hypothetical protein